MTEHEEPITGATVYSETCLSQNLFLFVAELCVLSTSHIVAVD